MDAPRQTLICMAEQQQLLLIADISGYTSFMRLHAMSLAHAQDIVNDLIDGLIDASGSPFRLCKIEGDAAFLHAVVAPDDDLSWLLSSVERMKEAFHSIRGQVAVGTVCVCGACRQVDDLRIKFVAHIGPVHVHQHRGVKDLGGFSVIVVHRLLKVPVPADEYLLATEPVLGCLPSSLVVRRLEVDLQDAGRVPVGYATLVRRSSNSAAPLPAIQRWKISLKRTWRTLPGILGLKKPCEGFRNIPSAGRESDAVLVQIDLGRSGGMLPSEVG